MDAHHDASHLHRPVAAAIAALLVGYGVALVFGLPQAATEAVVASKHLPEHGEEHEHGEGHDEQQDGDAVGESTPSDDHADASDDHSTATLELEHSTESGGEAEQGDALHAAIGPDELPPIFMAAPFILLLASIAILPLMRFTAEWWESNVSRLLVAVVLAAITLGYYAFFHGSPVDAHWPVHSLVQPTESGPQWQLAATVLINAMLGEYTPFIVLLFSLYAISGGIRVDGYLAPRPVTNALFIGVGGVLASFLGTTGAAMILIRPLLEANASRRYVQHTVVFFIFVVCNCGGLLLPIGDPPLFLGYLRGVPFTWTLSLWQPWLFTNGVLIALYYLWDHFLAYPHESSKVRGAPDATAAPFRVLGLAVNGPLLLGVVLAVALLDPSKPFPGTTWHAPMFLREAVQLGLVAVSLVAGEIELRKRNRFTYHAILEVAALFLGIFICMQPVLQMLNVYGPKMGFAAPYEILGLGVPPVHKFYWVTGALSSVLDNAPTYLVFFETARSIPAPEGVVTVAGVLEAQLVAISLAAVFMGAMTYIGNGPNFMVKAIAESSGVKMPSFFGYILYSVCVLLPVLIAVSLLFLKT